MTHSIQETIHQLHVALKQYIEATYHISAPTLIAKREALLDRAAVIHQIPYLESTPRYKSGANFADIVGLPDAALDLFSSLAVETNGSPRILYDPPYSHQSEALKHALVDGKNIVIMTGTGSGKTESFLLPVLGKLAREAKANPDSFADQPAMRSLLLYPMNALVNDQLGRLRTLFGDTRVVDAFRGWAGRPARFARYTSRTPYAGMRTSKKDHQRLKSFDDFFVTLERDAGGPEGGKRDAAIELIAALKDRGKWPAKPNLIDWYGASGSRWQNSQTGEYARAVTLPNDTELITRHEIQSTPADLMVTNYSMLEYMLMRPIERSIFDATRAWLAHNPDETFLVVLDEAHLYRGAAGAEVGLLLRRLRDRLGISIDRFQVICATASFNEEAYAPEFGSQLSGAPASTFKTITGSLKLQDHEASGTIDDAQCLANIDIDAFQKADHDGQRRAIIQPLLNHRGCKSGDSAAADLYAALVDFPPMSRLINSTMKQAQPVADLGSALFPNVPTETADLAVTALMALGSIARRPSDSAGLLPCRIHNFFRGLPGLWVCMDPDCTEVDEAHRDDIAGAMYSQPRNRCGCGAPVLEFFTCRNCGTAYARAYTDNIETPSSLWSEPGQRFRLDAEEAVELFAVDLLLEHDGDEELAEPYIYDLETGRLNPFGAADRSRTVYLRSERHHDGGNGEDNDDDNDTHHDQIGGQTRGLFVPCAVCGQKANRRGDTSVQDHQTKGDQPFQALVARQIQIQPPAPVTPTRFAPLQGRKVLVFSDSRQVAARLAPNLQMYSVRDSMRPLIAYGYQRLQRVDQLRTNLNLSDLFLGVLLGSKALNVRLRPETTDAETFDAIDLVDEAFVDGAFPDDDALLNLWTDVRQKNPPRSLLAEIVKIVTDRYWGVEALAVASFVEMARYTRELHALPSIPGIAETPEDKVAVVRAWIRCWRPHAFWLQSMPTDWWRNTDNSERFRVGGESGHFVRAMRRILGTAQAARAFENDWLPQLLNRFTEDMGGNKRRLLGASLSLDFSDGWRHCRVCKSLHRPIATVPRCLDCGRTDVQDLAPDTDPVFLARKGFYRIPVMEALQEDRQPMALIAAEHTAQLNSSQVEDVFSKAEENELLFQDIELPNSIDGDRVAAIDVLSSTTTMEVGIDLGQLSGVALRNMPPGRANYQQRAGRAGRRGNAVATVIGFGSADSHDEHYFTNPKAMISGDVIDPSLTLSNAEIVRRHIRAFLLQMYHQHRLPEIDSAQPATLFSVLGRVKDFKNETSILNRPDFAEWLHSNVDTLRLRVEGWIPDQLVSDDRTDLLDKMICDCLHAIDGAIDFPATDDDEADQPEESVDTASETNADEDNIDDATPEVDDAAPRSGQAQDMLLDRLLYCGILPRYAFPTDVATFHVFDRNRSSVHRPVMRFAPSQGLPIALSQYAPGKQVWISGKCYTSGAIYSVIKGERFEAWEHRSVYIECSNCGFADRITDGSVERDFIGDCRACGGIGTYGPARNWIRPPGFAHPIDEDEVTSPDEIPETSYATRAKLTMGTPGEDEDWEAINERLRLFKTRRHLLVSNTGPAQEGYDYCLKCGRITSTEQPLEFLWQPHAKPFPSDDNNRICPGDRQAKHVVLGTDFITDVALLSLRVDAPMSLRPGNTTTDIALRTLCEALAKAGCELLGIEPGELLAEFRPALTPDGRTGLEAEIFIYDTLPGGAGFSTRLTQHSKDLLDRALDLLKNCPAGDDCDTSCYRCLRSFKNKFEHRLLDRHVGAELLEFLITGVQPAFNASRIDAATDILFKDLERFDNEGITIQRNAVIDFDGRDNTVPILATTAKSEFVIGVSAPLSESHPANPNIALLRDKRPDIRVIIENELLVRNSLATATRNVRRAIAGE